MFSGRPRPVNRVRQRSEREITAAEGRGGFPSEIPVPLGLIAESPLRRLKKRMKSNSRDAGARGASCRVQGSVVTFLRWRRGRLTERARLRTRPPTRSWRPAPAGLRGNYIRRRVKSWVHLTGQSHTVNTQSQTSDRRRRPVPVGVLHPGSGGVCLVCSRFLRTVTPTTATTTTQRVMRTTLVTPDRTSGHTRSSATSGATSNR